jgi:hypothetical protein
MIRYSSWFNVSPLGTNTYSIKSQQLKKTMNMAFTFNLFCHALDSPGMIVTSIVKIASLSWQCTCIFMCHHHSTHIMFNITFYFQVELRNFHILSLILMWDTNFIGDRVGMGGGGVREKQRKNEKVIGLCNTCTVTNCNKQWELMSLFQKWHLTHMTSMSVVDQATKVTIDHLMTSLSQKTLHKPHRLKLITIFQGRKCPVRDGWKVPYSFGLKSQQPILPKLKSMKV